MTMPTQASQLDIESHVSKLNASGVIPDVLPSSIKLQGMVHVVYPTVRVSGGEVPHRDDTKEEPTIEFTPVTLDTESYYTIIMTDPDLFMRNDKMSGQVRHWLQRNVKFDSSGKASISEPAITKYLQCSPGLGTGNHRYIFIVARQPSLQSETFFLLSKPSITQLTSGGPSADLLNRMKFDAAKYIQEAELEVVGVTWMEVGGTVGSTVDDVKMVGESLYNKVMGK